MCAVAHEPPFVSGLMSSRIDLSPVDRVASSLYSLACGWALPAGQAERWLTTPMRERIEAIDFWRGAALITIFINHIPGNILGNFTPRNFGFSDSAEAFVFLSGVSVVHAYRERFEAGPAVTATKALISRAVRLYKTHLILTIVAALLFGVAAALTGREALLAEHGRGTAFVDPLRGALGILTLSHQIGYFNILPLYVIFLIAAPALFVLGLKDRWKMLAASAGLYAATRASGLNLPSWPDEGVWYFNPMSWQLMFALGMFCGFGAQQGGVLKSRTGYVLAYGFTVLAAIIVSDAFGLVPGLVDVAGEYLDWDKTQLGTVRVIDFAALAYVIYCSRVTSRLRSLFFYPAASRLGRHALPVYCIGSVLSGIGQIVTETFPASPLFDVLFVVFSLKLLHEFALLMERRTLGEFVRA